MTAQTPAAIAQHLHGFAAGRLRLVPVIGDGMMPTLRGDYDCVLAAPVTSFAYDTLYVVDFNGSACVYRCQASGRGFIAMMQDNPAHGATPAERSNDVPREWFDEHVLGIVVCDLKVRDRDLMLQAWQEAGR